MKRQRMMEKTALVMAFARGKSSGSESAVSYHDGWWFLLDFRPEDGPLKRQAQAAVYIAQAAKTLAVSRLKLADARHSPSRCD